MVIEKKMAEYLVHESVRQIKMRPYLANVEISSDTIKKWTDLIESVSPSDCSPLTRVKFNTQDYEVNKKQNRVLTIYLRGIIRGDKIEEYYQRLAKMGENERRFFGKFSSEYEFDRMIQNNRVREVLSGSPNSLLYRLDDYNPYISGSGHRKRRPLLVFEKATDEEVREISEIEKKSTKRWGYSDYGK